MADRYARAALKAIGEDLDGGVVALAIKHMKAVKALGEPALALLQPFVQGVDLTTLKDWRSVDKAEGSPDPDTDRCLALRDGRPAGAGRELPM